MTALVLGFHMLLQRIRVLEHAPAFLALDPCARIKLLDAPVHEAFRSALENVVEPAHNNHFNNMYSCILYKSFFKNHRHLTIEER